MKIASRQELAQVLRSSDKGKRKSILEALGSAFERAQEQGGSINQDALDELYACYCEGAPDKSWYAYLLLKRANNHSVAVAKEEFHCARSSQFILLSSIFIVRLPETERIAFLSPFVLDDSNTTRCRAAANMLDDCFANLASDIALRAALISDHNLPFPALNSSSFDVWLNELQGPYPNLARNALLDIEDEGFEKLFIYWEKLPTPIATWALREATNQQLNIATEKVEESLRSDSDKKLTLTAFECYESLAFEDESLLVNYFSDLDPDIRAAAISVGQTDYDWISRLEKEESEKVCLVILDKMKETCDSQNIMTLIGCFEDRSWRIRARAVDALVALGEKTLKPLKAALKKDNKHVKSAAVTALYRLGREDSITVDLL